MKIMKFVRAMILRHYPKMYWDKKYCQFCGKKVRGVFGETCKKCMWEQNNKFKKWNT